MEEYRYYDSCEILQIMDGVKNKNKKWGFCKRFYRKVLTWFSV